jgi:pSer/pThr/pTyr-binding forkhead associated (FHA) protein
MLVVLSGTQPGRQIMLNGNMDMGRSQDNAIWVNDTNASRRHAIIEPGQDGFMVTDNNSTNGTWVNGRRIGETVALKEGDQLVIGDTEFEVRRAASADG